MASEERGGRSHCLPPGASSTCAALSPHLLSTLEDERCAGGQHLSVRGSLAGGVYQAVGLPAHKAPCSDLQHTDFAPLPTHVDVNKTYQSEPRSERDIYSLINVSHLRNCGYIQSRQKRPCLDSFSPPTHPVGCNSLDCVNLFMHVHTQRGPSQR